MRAVFYCRKVDLMTLNILGSEYEVYRKNYDDEPYFEKAGIDGWCDRFTKQIIYCDMMSFPAEKELSEEKAREIERQILRHEIVHAFFFESGLADSSNNVNAWAVNEEMIDWIALQFPKILKAFQECDCI